MKKGKVTLFLLILTVFFILSSACVLAEGRNIYVGDLIQIRVTSQKITTDELKEKFKDFEIVDIKNEADSYLVTLRSFEPGEKTVRLGDKEIKIDVKSTLKEIKRDNIFEGDLKPEAPGFSMGWQYVFYALLLIFLSTGGITLWRYLKKRKLAQLSPYQQFMNRIKNISLNDRELFVKATLSFKEYLESKFSCRIRGKTSSEILGAISSLPDLQAILPEVRSWLEESDRFKFAGVAASMEEKQESGRKLAGLVEKIEGVKEGGL